MRVINRTAVTLVGKEPYQEWMRTRDADFAKNTLTVARTKVHGACILLSEYDHEEDLLEWVEDNHGWLFEVQLAVWTEDESAWPSVRNLKTFREWFRVEIHNTVVDASDEEVEGEAL